jgi:hypothetical protein
VHATIRVCELGPALRLLPLLGPLLGPLLQLLVQQGFRPLIENLDQTDSIKVSSVEFGQIGTSSLVPFEFSCAFCLVHGRLISLTSKFAMKSSRDVWGQWKLSQKFFVPRNHLKLTFLPLLNEKALFSFT